MSDLSDQVTVFLITVGASSLEATKRALAAQSSEFRLEVVDHVTPMSAAFQQMLDRCETPFYIQVDEDMVLKPTAVETMYRDMLARRATDQKLAMVAWPLFDQHLDRTILGVKIYYHPAFVEFPYADTQSCEMNQLTRMTDAGWKYETNWGAPFHRNNGLLAVDNPVVMGYHGTTYTPREAFERYRDLVQKYRIVGGNDWVRPWPQRFFDAWLENRRDVDLWSFLGAVVGLTSDPERGEKDATTYATMPDFGELQGHLPMTPHRLDVYTTTRCNLHCSFCSRQQAGVDSAPDFSVDLMRQVLAAYPSIKSTTIAGFGEPLMAPHLPDLIREARSHGLFTSLITNGTLITREIDRVPWHDLGYINVSLNASNSYEYTHRTGMKTGLELVLAGVAALRDRNVPHIWASFVIDQENWPRIPAYLKLAADHGIEQVSLVNTLPHHDISILPDNASFLQHRVISESNTEIIKALEGYRDLAARLGVHVNCWPVPLTDSNPRLCRSPFESIGVDGAGNITGCCRCAAPHAVFGNIRQDPKCWQENPLMVQLRRSLSGATDLIGPCSMCFGNWRRG